MTSNFTPDNTNRNKCAVCKKLYTETFKTAIFKIAQNWIQNSNVHQQNERTIYSQNGILNKKHVQTSSRHNSTNEQKGTYIMILCIWS